MNRRRVLLGALAGMALAGPFSLHAQRAPRRVHVLHSGTAVEGAPGFKALSEGLLALGWVQGRNLAMEVSSAEGGPESLTRLAAEIVRAAPEVVVAYGPSAAQALKKTGTSLPVVFIAVFNPIALGLAESLPRPGGSFTGLSTGVAGDFFSKQLSLLREAVPKATRLAMLSNPSNPIHALFRNYRTESARKLGFEPIELQAAKPEEIEPAFREAARQRAGAMYVGGDPLAMSQRPLIAELALRHRLPTLFLFSQHVEAGGLMSYGTNLPELSRRAAGYVDKILKGALPRDLPIEQPTTFDLAINLKTAKALGLTIPQSLLLRANRVIE